MNRIEVGKWYFGRLVKGSDMFGPSVFDERMSELGLTPEDIGETLESVAEAKQAWRVREGKEYFGRLVKGSDMFGPEQFDESVARAKQAWRVAAGKTSFRDLVGGEIFGTPERFDERMSALGLAPEDIGETLESVSKAKQAWAVAAGKRDFRYLTVGNDPFSPEQFDQRMCDLGLTPEDIDQTDESVAEAKAKAHRQRQAALRIIVEARTVEDIL